MQNIQTFSVTKDLSALEQKFNMLTNTGNTITAFTVDYSGATFWKVLVITERSDRNVSFAKTLPTGRRS